MSGCCASRTKITFSCSRCTTSPATAGRSASSSEEFFALYEAGATRPAVGLTELPLQYADFAVWQREWLHGDVLEAQLAYWREQLARWPRSNCRQTSHARPSPSHRGGAVASGSMKSWRAGSKQLSLQQGVTLFMTLMAAFQVLLARYSDQTDIAVGTDIANRNRLETEPLIGFFVNQLVLRADLSENPTFVELLQQTHRTTLDAYFHQDVPFERLVDEVMQPHRDLSRSPLFQVKLVLQNAAQVALALPDLKVSALEEQHQVAKFDLTFILTESPSGIAGRT